jgi:hypothetical protein
MKKGDWESHSEWSHSHSEEHREEFKRRREQREEEDKATWNYIKMEGLAKAESYKNTTYFFIQLLMHIVFIT